jgi:diacylglycerol kinase (ATP)
MRLALFHNPTSGEEDHRAEELVALLAEAGHDVVYRSLKDEDWADGLTEPCDVIVIAGGDGSVRKVLTAPDGFPITATIFPIGSANNIARTLGFATDDPAELLAGWEPAARRAYDVWSVTSEATEKRFVESFGGGLFAEVLARADEEKSPSGDEKVDRGLEILAEVVREAQPRVWELVLDGAQVREELLGFEALNVRELGPNLHLAPNADPGDRLLDVVLIRPDDRDALLAYVESKLDDEGKSDVPIRLASRKATTMSVADPGPLHVDDKVFDAESSLVDVRRTETQIEVLVPARS